MDEVTGTMIRIPVAIVLFIVFMIGLIGLLKKAKKKKRFIALLIIPIILVYTMYFSGYLRRSPLTERNMQEIIEVYQALGEADSQSLQSEGGKIKFGLRLRNGSFEEETAPDSFIYRVIEKMFSKTGEIDGRKYLIEGTYSDKGDYWEAACHDGYIGVVYIQLDDFHYLSMDYKISRNIDKWLGFFYAPPVFETFSLTQ